VLLLVGAVGACGLITDESRIKVAQIGDEAITRGDLDNYIQQLPIEKKHNVESKQAKLDKLREMVDRMVLLKEADKRGIQASDEEIDNEMARRGIQDMSPEVLEQYGADEGGDHEHGHAVSNQREDIAIEIRLAKLQRQAIPPGLTVSDEEIEQVYEANKARFVEPESVFMRFVTCASMEEAQKILERTRAGEDFAEIVRKTAAETQGKSGQGSMALASVGPPELNDAIRAAEPGDILGPIRRAAQFDLVQLIDRRAAREIPLDELRNRIGQQVIVHKARQAQVQFFADLNESYKVQIFPDNLPEDMPYRTSGLPDPAAPARVNLTAI
jgi:foldase protein PrsA